MTALIELHPPDTSLTKSTLLLALEEVERVNPAGCMLLRCLPIRAE